MLGREQWMLLESELQHDSSWKIKPLTFKPKTDVSFQVWAKSKSCRWCENLFSEHQYVFYWLVSASILNAKKQHYSLCENLEISKSEAVLDIFLLSKVLCCLSVILLRPCLNEGEFLLHTLPTKILGINGALRNSKRCQVKVTFKIRQNVCACVHQCEQQLWRLDLWIKPKYKLLHTENAYSISEGHKRHIWFVFCFCPFSEENHFSPHSWFPLHQTSTHTLSSHPPPPPPIPALPSLPTSSWIFTSPHPPYSFGRRPVYPAWRSWADPLPRCLASPSPTPLHPSSPHPAVHAQTNTYSHLPTH